jgi:hypothetical protein
VDFNGRIPADAAMHRGRPLRSGSSTGPRTRTRCTSTASIRPTWTACRWSGAGSSRPGEEFTYTFDAEPFGLHLYHCHVGPLAEHISRACTARSSSTRPAGGPPADEMVHGASTGSTPPFDGQGNQLYASTASRSAYMQTRSRCGAAELVRIYLVNILEYDPINSFHLHGNFFDYYPTGTRLEPSEYTDTVVQAQGPARDLRGPVPATGRYMFHAHKTEFADLGWMGMFDVVRGRDHDGRGRAFLAPTAVPDVGAGAA